MNGSATDADVLKFFDCGSFGSGDGCGYGRGSGYDYSCGFGYGFGNGDGYGSDYGDGYGSDYGDGRGNGCGSGDGSGSGYGYDAGYGRGDGCGDGIKVFNGQKVFCVDDVKTIISSVHGAYAKGYILLNDLTLKPIYIAKVGGFFAHGDTLREAREDVFAKYMGHRPVEQRIADFIKAHPSKTRKYTGEDLYSWHGILTGSCRAGRTAWCKDKGLDPKITKLTVKQFCELTRNSYGGDVIRRLAETVGIERNKEGEKMTDERNNTKFMPGSWAVIVNSHSNRYLLGLK